MKKCCTPPDEWLYGGPYSAVSLVPFSSFAAAVMKPAGFCFDHCAIVLGLSSGEDRRIVRSTANSVITPIAITSSLMRS